LKLNINSWRWEGVPVYIRAGKCLPVTCTEMFVTLRDAPPVYIGAPTPNHLRFRLNPDVSIALGAMTKTPGEAVSGTCTELMLSHFPDGEEMEAYERLLGDALLGDATLFAREDSVEAAWRIVEPVLDNVTPIEPYDPGSWGPASVAQRVAPPRGWHNPHVP